MSGTFDTIVAAPAGDWAIEGFIDGVFDDALFDALVFDVEISEPAGIWAIVSPPEQDFP